MKVTFENVEITVPSLTPAEAYNLLCSTLEGAGFEYMTDTFTASPGGREGDTSDLWLEDTGGPDA